MGVGRGWDGEEKEKKDCKCVGGGGCGVSSGGDDGSEREIWTVVGVGHDLEGQMCGQAREVDTCAIVEVWWDVKVGGHGEMKWWV